MITKLNPFHRRVGDASVRQSETLLEVSEEGLPARIVGEGTSLSVAPQSSDISVNIMGGGTYQDSSRTHFIITITYQVGTDGGYWEQMYEDRVNGIERLLSLTSTTEDARSVRLNGGRASRYDNCHILTHVGYEDSDASASSFKSGTVTLYAPADAKTILRQYRPVQGV